MFALNDLLLSRFTEFYLVFVSPVGSLSRFVVLTEFSWVLLVLVEILRFTVTEMGVVVLPVFFYLVLFFWLLGPDLET